MNWVLRAIMTAVRIVYQLAMTEEKAADLDLNANQA
jgi:hypothetical protein